MVTIGDQKTALTIGSYILGGGVNGREKRSYYDDYENDSSSYNHIVLSNMNFHHRISDTIKIMVDASLPIANKNGSVKHTTAVVAYSIRVGGDMVSGDIGFILPIHEDMGSTMRYFPLGIPLLSLNFTF